MTQERKDQDGWKGKDWAGEDAPQEGMEKSATWNKSEYVGDRGQGLPAPVPPADMPKGEDSIGGRRQVSGESHWADTAPAADTAAKVDTADSPKT